MGFNKTKAMKNAERYLTQGKIQAAISEYKQVVENDSKDINSRNMLGDLYIKADDTKAAFNCYQAVAEHYNSLGFDKKAIAIYNKIYRIDPSSIEVSSKLAELYEVRGSNVEAIKHYKEVANRYEEKGHKLETLSIWEKIADIAPNDTEIYLKIAEAYWQDDRREDASKAYLAGAKRLSEHDNHKSAVEAFSRVLEIDQSDLVALVGLAKSQIALGFPEEGAKVLEAKIDDFSYDQELNYLLMDCYCEMGDLAKAEESIFKFVEREPANYKKLLELVTAYLENDDLDSAIKALEMASEHLLANGEAEELSAYLNEVLARNPEHIQALRILVRLYRWERDESELKSTLERLADSANINGKYEDEQFALSQFVLLVPHDTARKNRLNELNEKYGFKDDENGVGLDSNSDAVPSFESFENLNSFDDSPQTFENNQDEFEMISETDFVGEVNFGAESLDAELQELSSNDEFNLPKDEDNNDLGANEIEDRPLSANDKVKLENELDSVKFYIEQGYTDLAEKSLSEVTEKFGKRKEIVELMVQTSGNLEDSKSVASNKASVDNADINVGESDALVEVASGNAVENESNSDVNEKLEEDTKVKEEVQDENLSQNEDDLNKSFNSFKEDLGLDGVDEAESDDYEEHYQHAVVYQEMGMLEEALREFQGAVACVKANDGSRRFLNCCTLIGLCFMKKEMPNLALTWFEKSFEVNDLNSKENLGVYYEIANALEANNEYEKALNKFEQIYSQDVDYRDTGERLTTLREKVLTPA